MSVIQIEIETAIRNVSWYTQQVGQKSLQRITIDFDAKTVKDQVFTGTTKILFLELQSIRDKFKVDRIRFVGDKAFFNATGQTASGVGVMPDIDYTFDIEVSKGIIKYSGAHDGYPSYNISVDGVSVYDCIQGWIGQLFGSSDVTVLLKKIPL